MSPPVILAALLGFAVASSCGPVEAPARVGSGHVVLILVDQLRKDSADAWMPGTNALAERGVRFEQQRSAAPWTYPSVLSLFSGLYPQQHGADGNHVDSTLLTFDPDVVLLHEALDAAGYDTAGFVTNPFLNPWNSFHEGFDHYDTSFIGDQGNVRGKGKVVWTKNMFADTVNEHVLAYYADRPVDGPEFTYVHYIDVHGPWGLAPFDQDYETSVRWIDEKIVELYEAFRARYDDDLIFVVTSDHGRSLDDDELVGEGSDLRRTKKTMHEFNLRVPLVVLPGASVPLGVVVEDSATHVDFVPTLLDWVGYDAAGSPHAEVLGRLQGYSWMPRLRSEVAPESARPLYARMSAFGWQTDSLVEGDLKHVRRFPPGRAEVCDALTYTFTTDPRELAPHRELFDDAARSAIHAAAGTAGTVFHPSVHRPDGEATAQLEALGYLGSDDDAVADSTAGCPGDG